MIILDYIFYHYYKGALKSFEGMEIFMSCVFMALPVMVLFISIECVLKWCGIIWDSPIMHTKIFAPVLHLVTFVPLYIIYKVKDRYKCMSGFQNQNYRYTKA